MWINNISVHNQKLHRHLLNVMAPWQDLPGLHTAIFMARGVK
jgi:hypothetical protein